ncbi:MAG TPA: hypothetical protein VMW19_21035 [Myxococcota bacterium]|nr:hypothetical protein [Myxococcota bacterium]
MSLETWLAFCATETVLCFTPGSAVLFVVSVALARGARVWIGLRMLLLRTAAVETDRTDAPPTRPVQRAFLRALVVQGANPKAPNLLRRAAALH